MRKLTKLLAIVLLICMLTASLVSCELFGGGDKEMPDLAGEVKLDMNSETLKQEVTVKTFVDGDTTHFYVPTSVYHTGVLKARYLAVNTPESTGKIEEWGKAASKFTRSKLESAVSIIVESDDNKWNIDSTGERFLVWVWYKPSEDADYRNLNLELLQEGLAIASNSANNRYGDTAMKCIALGKEYKLHLHSGEKDPDFFYGKAYPITIKELRLNTEAYTGANVAIEGVITRMYNNGAYIESYDEESDMYFGFYLYYGFNLNGFALDILSVGHKVRVVGSCQYYEAGDSYQIAGIIYNVRKPDDPSNTALLGEGYEPAYQLTDAETFLGKVNLIVNVDGEEVEQEFDYAELVLGTSISMENLKVVDVYTTSNEESSQQGAMTLTCKVDGKTISVRTAVLKDADGNLVTADYFNGKTIDVKGFVDRYDGTYQIRVLSINDVTVK